ncbi:MAG: helix-turn-helix domain-containing protein [Actinomycetota bacterium]|nr:helix-turn-helix domain-containing protein [Actinomycetota bacterium]
MSQAATILRDARRRSGLTQAELAKRLGTSQAAIARLERPKANPTVATLRRALRAAGHGLELQAEPRPSSVDLPQLLVHLRMTPAERLRAHQAAYDNMRRLVTGAAGDG